jgi:hypothetical protein
VISWLLRYLALLGYLVAWLATWKRTTSNCLFDDVVGCLRRVPAARLAVVKCNKSNVQRLARTLRNCRKERHFSPELPKFFKLETHRISGIRYPRI